MEQNEEQKRRRRANLRLALLLGLFAIASAVASILKFRTTVFPE